MNEEYQPKIELSRYEVSGSQFGRHVEVDIRKELVMVYVRSGCDGLRVNSRIDVETPDYIQTVYNRNVAADDEAFGDVNEILNHELEAVLRTAAAWLLREERLYDLPVLDDNPTYKRLLVALEAHCKPFLD